MNKYTIIDGIGSSQALDTSCEVVDLKGLDCSSLIGGALNWEHLSTAPSQIIGKILNYKKIFSEEDCETERHLYFWNKIKLPFLYILGRLFDDKKESSKEAAALFLDDAEHPNEHPMVGFSVEGARIAKEGSIITRSIARKVTITNTPANKTCLAELVPQQTDKPKDDLDSIFKTETNYCVELVKSEDSKSKLFELLNKKEDPEAHAKVLGIAPMKKLEQLFKLPPSAGQEIGRTKSGKSVFSHAKPGTYSGFTAQDHRDASSLHYEHAQEGKGIPGAPHLDRSKRHMLAADSVRKAEAGAEIPTSHSETTEPLKPHKMYKALDAGSGMAAPSALTGGAALAKESLDKKLRKTDWLKRAEEEYQRWDKREKFESYMSKKMPHLTKGEVTAIGQVMALNKALRLEKALAKLNPDLKKGK